MRARLGLRSLIPRGDASSSFLSRLHRRSFASNSKSVNNFHSLDLTFTPKQLNTLHSIAQHWLPEDALCHGQAFKLTRQDTLSAYLVTLQNRCSPQPIHTLVNLTEVRRVIRFTAHHSLISARQYRNRTAVDPRPATLQRQSQPANGENFYISPIDLSSARDLASISRAIRRSMATARSRDLTRETCIMLSGTRHNTIINQLRARLGVSPNSTAAWINSQSFLSLGQGVLAQLEPPEYTQLYNEVSGEGAHMFSTSPIDGTRNTVVSLRVPGEIGDRMVDIMASDLRRLSRGCEMLLPEIQDRENWNAKPGFAFTKTRLVNSNLQRESPAAVF
ncbi:hypothetical protein DFH08DRAFT_874657 [Mycena albidolilacea]|uniref:Uncharacterized protein n=1 Tax=Mycena albidolilacea TaxID=1033008 RepID=A0AAD6ZVV6_9AGAR|nr:hypothetical protein DFH08DRAFT_874657 [Mycena albidolilacea]